MFSTSFGPETKMGKLVADIIIDAFSLQPTSHSNFVQRLVLASASLCGPCNSLASYSPAFVASLRPSMLKKRIHLKLKQKKKESHCFPPVGLVIFIMKQKTSVGCHSNYCCVVINR